MPPLPLRPQAAIPPRPFDRWHAHYLCLYVAAWIDRWDALLAALAAIPYEYPEEETKR